MRMTHGCTGKPSNLLGLKRSYKVCNAQTPMAPMFLSLLLARLNRAPRFTWSPAIHVEDATIRSNLIPGALQ